MSGPQRYVLSGCSGGGKSTLLNELRRLGFPVFEEPGRQIVREEEATGGDALPWVNPEAFATKAIEMSVAAFDNAADMSGHVFFDRSFLDAISYVAHINGQLKDGHRRLVEERRYADLVFLTPPWPEIFEQDAERQASFDDAVAEYDRLLQCFAEFGYHTLVLPKVSVKERADVLLEHVRRDRP